MANSHEITAGLELREVLGSLQPCPPWVSHVMLLPGLAVGDVAEGMRSRCRALGILLCIWVLPRESSQLRVRSNVRFRKDSASSGMD